jgi:hypothetical protein
MLDMLNAALAACVDPHRITARFTPLAQNFSTFMDGGRYVGPDMVARITGGGPDLSTLDD